MASIDVRVLVRDSKGAWSDQVAGTLDTNPTRWAIVSPLIVKRPRGPPSLASVMAETSLLLDHLVIRHGEPLRWSWRSRRSPTHLARFMTESLGLALAGDLAQLYGWHPGLAMMLDADDLPTHLKTKLAPMGSHA